VIIVVAISVLGLNAFLLVNVIDPNIPTIAVTVTVAIHWSNDMQ